MIPQFNNDAKTKQRFAMPFYSVGMKLFLIIFCSVVACVMTVGLVAYDKAKNIVESKVADASEQTINQIAGNLDTVFKNYEDMTMQLMVDKDFHGMVRSILDNNTEFTKSELTGKIKDRVHNYVMGNITVSSVALIPLNSELGSITIGNVQADKLEALREAKWFNTAIEMDSRPYWVPPQQQGFAGAAAPTTIAMSRLIKDDMTNKHSYLLLMEIHLASIVNRFDEVAFGEGSEVAIIDEEGSYVYYPEADLIGQMAKISLPQAAESPQHDTFTTVTTDGIEVLTVYAAFDKSNWRMVGTVPIAELAKASQDIQTITWITVGIAALIAVGIGLLVIGIVARPLARLRNLMNEGARGNLAVRSAIVQRRDEIGELSASFNDMMKQLNGLAMQTTSSATAVLTTAAELTDVSRNTATAAKEIAIATDEIAGGAASLAVEAERGADFTASFNQQMSEVIVANGQMATSANEAKQASEQGTTYMRVLTEKTAMTEEMTRAMVNKVDKLKENTKSIASVLDLLNGITQQTNILSLNASIEAARAGSAGKGFMVVADEIRTLAYKSRQSIAIVSDITDQIRNDIEETAQVLSEAYPIFHEQIDSVSEANQLFVAVQEQMELFTNKLELASHSIGELNETQAVLTDAMTNVNAVAQQSSATSQEVASLSSEQLNISGRMVELSEKLEAVSQQLQASLANFRTS